MPKPIDFATFEAINTALTSAGNTWADLIAHCTSANPVPAAPAPASDVDAAWVKATAEAILKSNCKLSTNAGAFVAQTFARASNYPTVRFSPKQWEWFNKRSILPLEVSDELV
jgi:hypothetical protein